MTDEPISQHPLTRAYEEDLFLKLQQQLKQELPDELANWLGRLALLYGLPFENLVPDVRMLPVESLRFFYIDTNWLEALIDGAFSIGAHSERDIRYHQVMQHVIREATDLYAGKLRRELRGETAPPQVDGELKSDERIRAGFLMRSAIVAGWPGLEVCGYRTDREDEGEKLELLRLERLAPEVLLCIFSEIPGLVVINEPAEGFHFGITGDKVWLRDPTIGERLSNDTEINIPWRQQEERVLDILALKEKISNSLPGTQYGAANLAVQMVDAPDKQFFGPPLFSLDLALVTDLDGSRLSDELRNRFLSNVITITDSAELKVDVVGKRWTIKDGDLKYQIRRGQGMLHVFHRPKLANKEVD